MLSPDLAAMAWALQAHEGFLLFVLFGEKPVSAELLQALAGSRGVVQVEATVDAVSSYVLSAERSVVWVDLRATDAAVFGGCLQVLNRWRTRLETTGVPLVLVMSPSQRDPMKRIAPDLWSFLGSSAYLDE